MCIRILPFFPIKSIALRSGRSYAVLPYYRRVIKFLLSQLLRLYHWKVVYILARACPHPANILSSEMDEPGRSPGRRRSSRRTGSGELAARRTFVTVCAGDATASPRYFRSAHMALMTERGISAEACKSCDAI